MPFGATHGFLRGLAKFATQSFFSRIHVDGEENVPAEGPVIVCANHHNSAVDPAMLSCFFPQNNRKLHYWAKSTLFKPGFARTILLDAGNIPVDRRTKDNQKLFASTFDMLKYGECVAVFPEGGSYTMPGLAPALKDGASWAALEYAKNIRETGRALSTGGEVDEDPKDVTIVIAGINYTDKSKYRSSAVMQFGPSISVEPYLEEFMVDPKSAVKKLTQAIREGLLKLTVHAEDWDTLHAARMARKMLWVNDRKIPLDKLRDIEQLLVDLFAQAGDDSAVASLQSLLLTYKEALTNSSLSHYGLSGVPLPDSLDPSIPQPVPTRFKVLGRLLLSTCRSLIRLPAFIAPLIVHLPIYAVGRYSMRFSHLEEDTAQNKIALGLVLAILTYLTLFFVAWLFLWHSPLGAILSAVVVLAFVIYHNKMVDDNYTTAKKLVASWRILVGIWAPKARQDAYTAIRRYSLSGPSRPPAPNASSSNIPLMHGRSESGGFGGSEEVGGENDVRRVLRLRLEANRALVEFLTNSEREGLRRKLEGAGAKIGGAVRAGGVAALVGGRRASE